MNKLINKIKNIDVDFKDFEDTFEIKELIEEFGLKEVKTAFKEEYKDRINLYIEEVNEELEEDKRVEAENLIISLLNEKITKDEIIEIEREEREKNKDEYLENLNVIFQRLAFKLENEIKEEIDIELHKYLDNDFIERELYKAI